MLTILFTWSKCYRWIVQSDHARIIPYDANKQDLSGSEINLTFTNVSIHFVIFADKKELVTQIAIYEEIYFCTIELGYLIKGTWPDSFGK